MRRPSATTILVPSGRAILPLPPKSPADEAHWQPVGALALWSSTDLLDPRLRLGTKYIELRHDAHPAGRFPRQKIGVVGAGWAASYNAGQLFIVRGRDANFSAYTDATCLTRESFGPTRCWLFQGVPSGQGDAWVDAVVLPRVRQTR